jgi:regulator of protease activity HflC (stomatin/prohibitin superfamily)
MKMVKYYKGIPTEFVQKYVSGKITREGRGLSFFYWPSITTIISVPVKTFDVDFIFREISGNFQAVTVQGQITYRIVKPTKLASILNFSIDPRSKNYLSRDPKKLPVRIINIVHDAIRAEIERQHLEELLHKGADLANSVLLKIKNEPEVEALGTQIMNIFVTTIKPTPEVSKALEADYRETLLKKADSAIYDRRAYAVEQERKIQENELDTDIKLESEREKLVDLKAANLKKEAEADGIALEVRLAPYKNMDPRTLTALGLNAIGENAEKIGTLTITPDLLTELLRGKD